MSASTEKKTRKTVRDSGLDRKTIAAQEEAAKKAKVKRNWTVGSVIAVVLVAALLFLNSAVAFRSFSAATIGGVKYTPAQIQYNMANQYYTFVNQYGSYASIFGLDTSYGISGIKSQPCAMLGDDSTWADYFTDAAVAQLQQLQAFCDYANQNGITLDADDTAEIQENVAALSDAAAQNDMKLNKFIKAYYGGAVNEAVVTEQLAKAILAQKGYEALAASYTYTDEELEAHYQSFNGDRDIYHYAAYTVNAEGEEIGEAELKAAKATADKIAEAYKKTEAPAEAETEVGKLVAAGENEYEYRFNTAVKEVVSDASATAKLEEAGSLDSAYADWMKGSAKPGDVTVVENSAANGYIVVVFFDKNDNHYNTASVRHILINAEADENGEYTDAALEAALAKAKDVLAQWENGEKTEDSFAALANEYSEDMGSNTTGGLYENLTQGTTVKAFNDFAFGKHQAGDTAIVYGTNGSYAGFHVMYYVGTSEKLYSNTIAEDDLVGTATQEWLDNAVSGLEVKEGYFMRLVG